VNCPGAQRTKANDGPERSDVVVSSWITLKKEGRDPSRPCSVEPGRLATEDCELDSSVLRLVGVGGVRDDRLALAISDRRKPAC
jgi:hypothetical protein